ncbi:MAG: 2Fe-2S iron-sulfur cluster-binding protein [Anaerolineae bacterium]
MSTTTTITRLTAGPNEVIDRSKTITFTFNGKQIFAHPGDSIASAVTAAGIKVIGRSFKYHRPRGLHGYGHEMNSMVQIGNEVSISAWLRPVEEGIVVKSVNAWPSPDRDIMSITGMGDRFLPVGFYYKTFIRPTFMWPTYEKVLRSLAGLGKLDIDTPLAQGYDKQYLHCDVAVVGSDPAGLVAAAKAADAGARVSLFTDETTLGGWLRFHPANEGELSDLIGQISAHPNVTIYTDTTVISHHESNWLVAYCGRRLYKIRTKAVVYATGALDQPLVFDSNDLPGILLGSAVERLLHLYGTTVGKKALIVTSNDDGWKIAKDLHEAGVVVMGIADSRPEGPPSVEGAPSLSSEVSGMGIPIFQRHTILKADGKKAVTGAVIAPVRPDGSVNDMATQHIDCDMISVSVGWHPESGLLFQSGTKMSYNDDRHEFLPTDFVEGVFAAGRVAGTHSMATELMSGMLAGQQAAAAAGFGRNPAKTKIAALAEAILEEPVRTSDLVSVPGKGKQFVDRDEDVTTRDIKTAIAEGYNSIELLKRYSTTSMGPSQGKWSNYNTIHMTARENDWTIQETGTTTSRPPTRPVEFGALGGQMMEPVRYTPVHDWHLHHGAKMMVAGLWMRPEHYGDPAAEVKAVRERVGLIDISTLGKMKLTGPGVADLLNKIYINKWSKLKVGRTRYGVMCNSEGVITDDGVTARVSENEWYMSTTSGGAAAVYETMQWWMQSGWGEGVHLRNVTEGRAAFNLAGPQSRNLLGKLVDDATALTNENFPYMGFREMAVGGINCRLMRIGFTGELSYEIHCPASQGAELWEELMAAGAEYEISPFGVEAQRILRLEKAHIIVGQDTDALTDPIMANLDALAKIDKHDFLGKRMVARAAENGVMQKLVGFKMISKDPQSGAPIIPEEGLQIVEEVKRSDKHPIGLKILGWVTSSRLSPTLNEVIGLCWLPTAMAEADSVTFKIRQNGELIEAKTHHGAFVDPEETKLKG